MADAVDDCPPDVHQGEPALVAGADDGLDDDAEPDRAGSPTGVLLVIATVFCWLVTACEGLLFAGHSGRPGDVGPVFGAVTTTVLLVTALLLTAVTALYLTVWAPRRWMLGVAAVCAVTAVAVFVAYLLSW